MSVLLCLGDLVANVLVNMPWNTGAREDRRAIVNREVRSGLRAVRGRVLNIGSEWSTGRCEVTPGHLEFVPSMGIVGARSIDVLAVAHADENFERMVILESHPTTTLLITTAVGDLYWQVPSGVVDDAIELLKLQAAP